MLNNIIWNKKNYQESGIWFTTRPVGHNILLKFTKTITTNAGVTGLKTNNGLKATYASRLYEIGVDENGKNNTYRL